MASAERSPRTTGELAGPPRQPGEANAVVAQLELDHNEADHLRIRAALMETVREIVRKRKLTQAEAAALLEVSQPRVSDLVRGKVDLFSIDALVDMIARAGVHVEVRTRRSIKPRKPQVVKDLDRAG